MTFALLLVGLSLLMMVSSMRRLDVKALGVAVAKEEGMKAAASTRRSAPETKMSGHCRSRRR